MTKIALEGMHFYGYHGYYAEEREIGGEYVIHATVHTDPFNSLDDRLESTINYEQIYRICHDHMEKKYKLIETLGLLIATEIKDLASGIREVNVRVEKLNPPIKGRIDKAVVTITV